MAARPPAQATLQHPAVRLGHNSRPLPPLLPPACPQVSPRTRWLVAHDWFRASVFGRNLSDI